MQFISEHFTDDEFRCKCCGRLPDSGIDKALLDRLEMLRAELCKLAGRDVAVSVTDHGGYRCHRQNTASGGARSSQHMLGNAADIQVKGFSPGAVAELAKRLFPKSGGIGTYKSFTHIDSRRQLARWNG